MRRLDESYRVVIGPGAWAQLGQLPRDAYVAVRTLLVAVAEAGPRNEPHDTDEDPVLARRRAGDYLAQLRIDDALRTVTLVDVIRAA